MPAVFDQIFDQAYEGYFGKPKQFSQKEKRPIIIGEVIEVKASSKTKYAIDRHDNYPPFWGDNFLKDYLGKHVILYPDNTIKVLG